MAGQSAITVIPEGLQFVRSVIGWRIGLSFTECALYSRPCGFVMNGAVQGITIVQDDKPGTEVPLGGKMN